MAPVSKLKDILNAVYRKDFSYLEKLSAAAVNLSDEDGRTPLMHAVLADDADPVVARLLIERGADVDAIDLEQKWSALHFAARDQKEALVNVLLEAGATVDAVNIFGNTPLWQSVMFTSPKIAVIRQLIEHGADPYRKNDYDVAPIDIARETGQTELVDFFENQRRTLQ